MTLHYAWPDETGGVERAGCGPMLPEGAVPLPDGILAVDAVRFRIVDGQWIERSAVPLPEVLVEGVERLIVYREVPPGTVCEVYDLDPPMLLGRAEDLMGTLEVRLVDPGRYRLELRPPVTHLSHVWEFEL